MLGLLIVGYILAVPPLLVILPALRQPAAPMKRLGLRWPWRVALTCELIGALLIAFGWLWSGNISGFWINGIWALIFSGLWIRAETKK